MATKQYFALALIPLLMGAAIAPSHDSDPLATCPIPAATYCEVNAVARDVGIDYMQVATRAAKGDVKALRQLLRFTTTAALNVSDDDIAGIAADSHMAVIDKLLARVGDAKFAAALSEESPHMRAAIKHDLDWKESYLARWYPRTAAAFGMKPAPAPEIKASSDPARSAAAARATRGRGGK